MNCFDQINVEIRRLNRCGTREKIDVAELAVDDRVRAVELGPIGRVTCTDGDWVLVLYPGRWSEAARTMAYRKGEERLYLETPAGPPADLADDLTTAAELVRGLSTHPGDARDQLAQRLDAAADRCTG
jgi:hypothetical protein